MNDRSPTIEPIGDEDIAPLCTYLEHYRGKIREKNFWHTRFTHWWQENPFYRPGMIRGQLLRDGGRIVGFVGVIPVPVQINHRTVTAFMSSSWGVDPEYRKQSLKLLARLASDLSAMEHPYILNNPIANTDLYYRLLGFSQIPIRYRRQFILYNGPLAHLSCNLAEKHAPPWIHRLLSVVEKRLYPLPRHFGKLRVEALIHAGTEFDDLWNDTHNNFANTRVRTANFINWYCFGNKKYHHKVLLGVFDGHSLTGFAIFRDGKRAGGRFLECLDLWFKPSIPETVASLFDYALRYSSANYYQGIMTFDYDGMADWLAKSSTFAVEDKTISGFYQLPKSLQQPITTENSYYVFGEGDVGI